MGIFAFSGNTLWIGLRILPGGSLGHDDWYKSDKTFATRGTGYLVMAQQVGVHFLVRIAGSTQYADLLGTRAASQYIIGADE
jgi:hypothetical protein